MYQAVHLAAECFPIAKVGGLGDVVGALPKYLTAAGIKTCVMLPRYNQKWNATHTSTPIHHGVISAQNFHLHYFIHKIPDADFGFDIYWVDIPEYLFRDGVYGYRDDALRFLFFQQAALGWICTWNKKPDVLHCHDHHTGLVPFMIHNCPCYSMLNGIKTVFTIHNGLYTGAFPIEYSKYFPDFPYQTKGLLEWDDVINPLASAIKCCDRLTTVSAGYLDELKFQSNPMNWLYNEYWQKSKGIVNGIDTDVWNPETDANLSLKLDDDWDTFKDENKKAICESMGLNPDLPLVVYIGRLNTEKGAEILTQAIHRFLYQNRIFNFYILGSGADFLEDNIRHLSGTFPNHVANYIGYNESLAHKLYAAADFLIMPSLVEPCGLNQMYAMRYGTISIVRAVGGLKDTVVDYGEANGYGIRFNRADIGDIISSLYRAAVLYKDKALFQKVRKIAVSLDFSWTTAVKQYIELYKN